MIKQTKEQRRQQGQKKPKKQEQEKQEKQEKSEKQPEKQLEVSVGELEIIFFSMFSVGVYASGCWAAADLTAVISLKKQEQPGKQEKPEKPENQQNKANELTSDGLSRTTRKTRTIRKTRTTRKTRKTRKTNRKTRKTNRKTRKTTISRNKQEQLGKQEKQEKQEKPTEKPEKPEKQQNQANGLTSDGLSYEVAQPFFWGGVDVAKLLSRQDLDPDVRKMLTSDAPLFDDDPFAEFDPKKKNETGFQCSIWKDKDLNEKTDWTVTEKDPLTGYESVYREVITKSPDRQRTTTKWLGGEEAPDGKRRIWGGHKSVLGP